MAKKTSVKRQTGLFLMRLWTTRSVVSLGRVFKPDPQRGAGASGPPESAQAHRGVVKRAVPREPNLPLGARLLIPPSARYELRPRSDTVEGDGSLGLKVIPWGGPALRNFGHGSSRERGRMSPQSLRNEVTPHGFGRTTVESAWRDETKLTMALPSLLARNCLFL